MKKKASITFETARKAKLASYDFQKRSALDRKKALKALSENILSNIDLIIKNNKKDLANARKIKLSDSMIDRLLLNSPRISAMAEGVLAIANQNEVVGEITSQFQHENGMLIKKQRIPLGVIGMIFESRPNVVIDCAALAIKSGNAIILKGGSEAQYTNACLATITQESISQFIPKEVVQLIAKREQVKELLALKQFIDVMIPRGGEKLIQYVCDHAKMPVIAHFKGLCHGYIHSDANLENAISICMNAKVQRPGVCNAIETLLLHKDLPTSFKNKLFFALQSEKVELRVNKPLLKITKGLKLAIDLDWQTEYLDKILSVRQVKNLDEAISHIQKYGTRHTEFICTESADAAQKFVNQIDASCVLVNASSRFNDGGALGLGAEIGISTSKIHAYGPMGAKELTIERYVIEGHGQIRSS